MLTLCSKPKNVKLYTKDEYISDTILQFFEEGLNPKELKIEEKELRIVSERTEEGLYPK